MRAIHQCKRRPPFGRLREGGTWPLPSGLAFVLSLSKHEREWTTIKWNPYKTKVIGKAGDMGVDVVAQNGAKKYAVQVKRYNQPVSRRAVSDAVAGKEHYGCNAAMVVTNNYFTKGAAELAQSTKCQLVDRDALADWIVDSRVEATQEPKHEENRTRVESEELSGPQLNTKIDPKVMSLGIQVAGYHIEAGARSFGQYAKKMVGELGEKVKPYLKIWYNAVREMPEMEKYQAEMTPPDEVERLSQPEILNVMLSIVLDEPGAVCPQEGKTCVEDAILPMKQPMPRKQSALDILIAQQRAAAIEREKKPPAQKAPAKKMAGKKRSQGKMPMTPTPPMKMKGLHLHRSPSPTSPVMPANILTPERVALVERLNQHPLNQKARELLKQLGEPDYPTELSILLLLHALAHNPEGVDETKVWKETFRYSLIDLLQPLEDDKETLDLLLGREEDGIQVTNEAIQKVQTPQEMLELLAGTLSDLAPGPDWLPGD